MLRGQRMDHGPWLMALRMAPVRLFIFTTWQLAVAWN
jgi:hypothetical protein